MNATHCAPSFALQVNARSEVKKQTHNALTLAMAAGDLPLLRALVATDGVDANRRTRHYRGDGRSALVIAIEASDVVTSGVTLAFVVCARTARILFRTRGLGFS